MTARLERQPPEVTPLPGERRVACLAASPGGHLAELEAVAGVFDGWQRIWVTGASRQADALRASGEEVRLLPAWGRDPPGMAGLVPNLRAAARGARELRPRIVVTTGAGLVVPFALMCRVAGAELVLVESMARVTSASLTARILAPFSRSVLVQWPELVGAFRRARVCRPALLEAGRAGSSDLPREGTFVSVGTRPEPFDRLLEMVDRAVEKGLLPAPIVAQSGASTYRPTSYAPEPSMAPEEVERALQAARYVVCHGGAAMISAAVAAGRRPLVLPRRRGTGEHRTEHQGQLVAKLAAAGAVVELRESIDKDELQAADAPWPNDAVGDELPSVAEAVREEAEAALARG